MRFVLEKKGLGMDTLVILSETGYASCTLILNFSCAYALNSYKRV
jgi:hypothetical protein